MLEELDPHSKYISKKDFKRTSEKMLGSFSGIGVEFNIVADSIVVVAAISGGPSEELGIKSGDRIVTVEKENVANIGIKNEDVIKKLRGKKGTVVKVQIKRKGEGDLLDFAITRDDIPLNSVDAEIMIDNKIGYIKDNKDALAIINKIAPEHLHIAFDDKELSKKELIGAMFAAVEFSFKTLELI